MRWIFSLSAAALLSGSFSPGVAEAAPYSAAFAVQAEADGVLAESCGGTGRDGEGLRVLVEPEARGFAQQVGRTSSVIMDNWWSQTGSALIANNLLANR